MPGLVPTIHEIPSEWRCLLNSRTFSVSCECPLGICPGVPFQKRWKPIEDLSREDNTCRGHGHAGYAQSLQYRMSVDIPAAYVLQA
jgi:hypothetical protein